MTTVECTTLYGQTKEVARDQLILRAAAYAMLVNDSQVLLVHMRHGGKYQLPGGGVQLGERIEDALKREVREETGLEVEVGPLVDFTELFFFYDPSGKAYHGLHFYYLCRAKSSDLMVDYQMGDETAENPQWVDVDSLRPQDFQSHGRRIIAFCRQFAGLPAMD